MALVDTACASQMLTKATSLGLIDEPTHHAMKKIYQAIATGVINTVKDPSATQVTVSYDGWFPEPAPIPQAFATGFTNMTPATFVTDAMAADLFNGPYSLPFHQGIAEVVQYVMDNSDLFDLLVPIAAALPGFPAVVEITAITFDAGACYDNIESEIPNEFRASVATPEPTPGINPLPPSTPTVFVPPGSIFLQMSNLIQAVSDSFKTQIEGAKQTNWTLTGVLLQGVPGFPQPASGLTTTTVIS